MFQVRYLVQAFCFIIIKCLLIVTVFVEISSYTLQFLSFSASIILFIPYRGVRPTGVTRAGVKPTGVRPTSVRPFGLMPTYIFEWLIKIFK